MTGRHVRSLLCFSSGARHAGKTVRPRGYWGLPAFASLSMAGSVGFVGSVVQAPDGRQALQLTTAERNMVLGEMRDFLVAVQAM